MALILFYCVGLYCCPDFPAGEWGLFSVVVCRILTMVASLVATIQALGISGFLVEVAASGLMPPRMHLPNQGSPVSLALAGGFQPLDHQESPGHAFFFTVIFPTVCEPTVYIFLDFKTFSCWLSLLFLVSFPLLTLILSLF